MCRSSFRLATILLSIERLSIKQADALIEAFNENGQVSASFGFSGSKPSLFGCGLFYHLERLTSRKHRLTSSGKIKISD
jgi:hypothetical protein